MKCRPAGQRTSFPLGTCPVTGQDAGSLNLEEPALHEFRIHVVPTPWNKGKLVGQKAPLKLKEIWAIHGGFKSFAERGN
jgi:hypothetical protein